MSGQGLRQQAVMSQGQAYSLQQCRELALLQCDYLQLAQELTSACRDNPLLEEKSALSCPLYPVAGGRRAPEWAELPFDAPDRSYDIRGLLREQIPLDMEEGLSRAVEYPHQFSGGMKQRVVIAIALACNPKLLIADEPTTALDVTIQAQVLDLMKRLKEQYDTSMILITHDLGIVAEVCDEVIVMYAGRIVEQGTLEQVFNHTKHPYTEGLFGSLPNINDRKNMLKPIPGLMPDPTDLPEGCSFSPRCPYATERCKKQKPRLKYVGKHWVECMRYDEENFSIERKVIND